LGDFFEALHQFENFPRQALVATGVILTISITAEVCQIAGKAIVRRSKTPRHGGRMAPWNAASNDRTSACCGAQKMLPNTSTIMILRTFVAKKDRFRAKLPRSMP
jgi:hypothetical protein